MMRIGEDRVLPHSGERAHGETGKAIVLHRRKYILESDLLSHLKSLAGACGQFLGAEEARHEG